jgi:hypothetical protein
MEVPMDMVERVRAALFDALQKQDSALGGPGTIYIRDISSDGADEVVVDGYVDLTSIAKAAIAAMRAPSEEMLEVYRRAFISGERFDGAKVYGAMIDAALTSSDPICQTCQDDPVICASIPMRHCEKATHTETQAPSSE